jgi:hypothetical protein
MSSRVYSFQLVVRRGWSVDTASGIEAEKPAGAAVAGRALEDGLVAESERSGAVAAYDEVGLAVVRAAGELRSGG